MDEMSLSTAEIYFMAIESMVLNFESQNEFLQVDGHFQSVYISTM